MKVTNFKKVLDYILVIILISMVMIAILEAASFFTISIYQNMYPSTKSMEPKYQNGNYWIEYDKCSEESLYSPFVYYIPPSNFHGEYINTDKYSRRMTWNLPESINKNIIDIFCFGGSTMWGEGSRDNYTIASYLSKNLSNRGYPTRIINFGVEGYTNSQELMRLLLELRNGNIPDIVIFYDGNNDIRTAYDNAIVGGPYDSNKWKAEFGHTNNPKQYIIDYCYQNSYTIKLIKGGLRKLFDIDIDTNETKIQGNVSEEICKAYFNNIRIIKTLGKEYGFKPYFFWQPTLYTKSYLSEDEKKLASGDDDKWAIFIKITYNYVRSRINSSNNLNVYDICNCFDEINDSIYLDDVHTTEEGNKIVANRIAESLIPILDCTNCTRKMV
jgi:lysophospholipase L1-like esterase